MPNRISEFALYHVRIPLDKPFYPSWIPGYPSTENRFDLVKITTEDGVSGYSAAPAISSERSGIGSVIAPYLLGHDATDIPLMLQRIREVGYLGIKAGWIEPAFWDIKARLEDKSVFELFQAKREDIELYASTGEIKDKNSRIAEAEKRAAEGFKTIKIRVHDRDVEEDIAHVKAVVDAVGDRMAVAVDANQGWRVTIINDAPLWDLARAKYFADACHEMGVAWIEEPLPMDDYKNLTQLAQYSRVPIAGGEINTGGKAELSHMIENHCYKIFQPDAIMTGGIQHSLDIAALCREHNLEFTPHTWTNGIGFAVNLQVLLASGFAGRHPLEYPINPPSWTEEKRDGILQKPFRHNNGVIEPDYSPGLGFEINEKALRKYGKLIFHLNKRKLFFNTLFEKGISTTFRLISNKKKYGVDASKS